MASPVLDIPLLSRIIAVADAYNAMTSNRPYRDAMPSRVARMRLAQAVESRFDSIGGGQHLRRYSQLRTRGLGPQHASTSVSRPRNSNLASHWSTPLRAAHVA